MTRNATASALPRQNAPAKGVTAGSHTPDVPSTSDGIQALQRNLGNQAVQRLAHAGALNNGMLLAARFGLGNQVMQRMIQRKINLGGDYLDDLSSGKAIFNNSTWVQVVGKYRQYYTTKSETTELTLINDMLTLIDSWIGSVQYGVATQTLSAADTEKRKRLLDLKSALVVEKPKLEERIKKRKIFEELGVPESYLDELTSADFGLLWSAHVALQSGDVGAADAALTKLKASIGDVVNMLKSALLKRHIGNVNPEMAKMMNDKKYQVTSKQTESRAGARLDVLDPRGSGAGNARNFREDSKKLQALTPLEVTALTTYSGIAYNGYNTPLRTELGTNKFSKEKLAITQVTVSALNKLKKYKGLVFRHDNNFAGFTQMNRVGATVSDMAFLSTTYDQAAIQHLLVPTTHEVLQILTSKSGRIIEASSVVKAEKEVLFKPGTGFTVTARFDRNADDSWTPKLSDAAKRYLDADPFKDKVKFIVFKTEA